MLTVLCVPATSLYYKHENMLFEYIALENVKKKKKLNREDVILFT